MDFLRFLEDIRTPVLTQFMSAITYCGSELFFLALAVIVFWCVSKRGGYYILLVGFLGTACSQFMKIWFRIPRPWVLDPAFHVVESARAGAGGYSFPSGHTQSIVGAMACVWFLCAPREADRGITAGKNGLAGDRCRTDSARKYGLAGDRCRIDSARKYGSAGDRCRPGAEGIQKGSARDWLYARRKWIRVIAVVLMILVPFSRMYLGCHTPLDVGVAFVLALALAVCFRGVAYGDLGESVSLTDEGARRRADSAAPSAAGTGSAAKRGERLLRLLLALSLLVSAAYLAFVVLYHFPADVDADNLAEATKNAYLLVGCFLGLILVKLLDDRYIHFEVDAVWWAQILKVALGTAALLAIRMGLKAPLAAVLPGQVSTAVRYFLMVVFAGALWPVTFRWFARLGKKERSK